MQSMWRPLPPRPLRASRLCSRGDLGVGRVAALLLQQLQSLTRKMLPAPAPAPPQQLPTRIA